MSLRERAAVVLRAAVDAFLPARSRRPGHDERTLLRERGFIRATLLIFCGLVVITTITAIQDGPADTVTLLWAAYTVIQGSNLLLVRLTGLFHQVNHANNLLGLLLMAALLQQTGGMASPYIPLFLAGVAITGNFGGNRPILLVMGLFIAVVVATYLAQLSAPGTPDDTGGRFAFLVTAAFLILLGNLSAQASRLRTRALLHKAKEAAEAGQRQAEAARAEAERALAELRAAQAQMVMQEKMASLGTLVAGVAHEVNTPVGLAVTGASQLRLEAERVQALARAGALKRSAFEDFLATVGELSALIEKNATRAGQLIQSFKEVAVDQSTEARRRFDLASYVDEVLASLSPQLRRARLAVSAEIPAGLLVDGYPGPLAQVVTNLVMNSALHGYPDGRAGQVTITARPSGPGMVEFTYRDDGVGIPHALWPRIFEPFFTTRRGSGGSGLGLHLVYNIVTATMGGRVAVGDAPGGGAEFTLVFPLKAPVRERDNGPEGVPSKNRHL